MTTLCFKQTVRVLIRSTIDLFSSDGVMNRTASLMTELGAGTVIRSVILGDSMGKYMSEVLSVHVVLLDMGQHCQSVYP